MKSNTNIKEGYKKTDVGVIPEEWEVKTFQDYADKSVKWSITGGPFGSNLKVEDYTEKGVRIIQLQNIGDGIFRNDYKIFTSTEKADELLSCNIYPNEIILSKMGDPVARACIMPRDDERYVMASDGIRLVIDENKFCKKYVHDYINSVNFRKRAIAVSTGSTRQRISLPTLKKIKVIQPPLPEQQAIANCLTTWDRGIETLTALIEAKREQKKGLMQQLLTGKKRLDGFTGEWKKIKLGNIGTFRTSSVNKKIEKDETKVWLLNYMDVYNNTHITSKIDFQLTSAKNSQIASSNLEVGDVLFTPSSETPDDIGHSAVVTENLNNVVFSYHLVRFRAKRNILDIKFSGYVFNKTEILNEFSRRATGSTRYTLSLKDFNEIETTIPPIDEQTAIANILSTADQEISLLEKKLEAMKKEKKGLMQVLLTGEKRLIE